MDEFANGFLVGQNDNGGGGFGNFGEGLWAVIILAILFGNGNFGGFGGFGNHGGTPCATQADVRSAVDQQTLISKLDQQTYGLADSTYALNNTISNGFHGVDRSVCDISHQLSDCCCATQRSIDGLGYNMSRGFCDISNVINMQTRDIIDNANANYRGLMDFMVQSKIDALRSENESLRLSASQAAQNQYLINQLRPSPIPAYPSCNPWASVYGSGTCGCGCA